ncbi:MAG: hypothetical protein ACK4E7_04555 [Permianibacter sp.]
MVSNSRCRSASPSAKAIADNPIDRDGLDAEQLQLLAEMGYDPVSTDELIARTGFGADVVAGMLLTLELNNVIAAVPGGYVRRR